MNLRAWSKRKMAWPKKIFRSLLLQTLGPGPALDGPGNMFVETETSVVSQENISKFIKIRFEHYSLRCFLSAVVYGTSL